jgi:hypothetical protein
MNELKIELFQKGAMSRNVPRFFVVMADGAYARTREPPSPSSFNSLMAPFHEPIKRAVIDGTLGVRNRGGSSRNASRRSRILLPLFILNHLEGVMIRDVLDHLINCCRVERLEACPKLFQEGGITRI